MVDRKRDIAAWSNRNHVLAVVLDYDDALLESADA